MGHNSCPKCGAGISGGGKKCGGCGAVCSILLFRSLDVNTNTIEADLFEFDAGLPSVENQISKHREMGRKEMGYAVEHGYAAMTLRTFTTDIYCEHSFALENS